jgi:tetratricopeptide (TPR) repeat protein
VLAPHPVTPTSSKASRLVTLLLDLVALLLLTMSAALLTDFARRLLGSDPDTIGMAYIAVQAALTVAATSTFTKTGWAFLQQTIGHPIKSKSLWRFGLAAVLFAVASFMWLRLPPQLAQYYNRRGFNLNQILKAKASSSATSPNAVAACPANSSCEGRADVLRDYQRAIALDPTLYVAYTNTGELLENFYRYDEAAEQYRKAILAQPPGTIDSVAYANLSRALVLNGKPMDALRVIQDAQLGSPNNSSSSQLYRNKAWAEYDLGFYSDAVKDGSQSGSAPGTCIVAKAYAKLGRSADESIAWTKFRAQYASNTPSGLVVEPDCVLLSEESIEKK